MRHLYFNLECTYKEGAPCSLDLTSSSNAPADDTISLIMREKETRSLRGAHENYTPIKLFSHLAGNSFRAQSVYACVCSEQCAIILIREDKMEIRAAGCCMRESSMCARCFIRTDWCSRALKSITTAACCCWPERCILLSAAGAYK